MTEEILAEGERLLAAGELATAIQLADRTLRHAVEAGDERGQALGALLAGKAHFRLGHYEKTEALARQALALANGDRLIEARAWILIGNTQAESCSLDEAERSFLQAEDRAREAGGLEELASATHNLACLIYLPRGQFALSLAADRDAKLISHREHWLNPFISIAWASLLSGRVSEAEAALADLAAQSEPGSFPAAHANWLSGMLAIDCNALAEAGMLLDQARALADRLGDPGLIGAVRVELSRKCRLEGNHSAALAWASEAVKASARVGYRHIHGKALIARARAAWEMGDAPACQADLDDAQGILTRLDARYDLAEVALFRAYLAVHQNLNTAAAAWDEAVRLILGGDFGALLARERAIAYPLLASALERSGSHAADARKLLAVGGVGSPLVVTCSFNTVPVWL